MPHSLFGYSTLSLSLAAVLLAGCENVSLGPPPKAKPKVVAKKVLTPQSAKRPKKVEPREELEIIDQTFRETRQAARLTGTPEEVAVRRVTGEIEKYLELGPTLVVWVIDRTNSSQKLVTAAMPAVQQFYESNRALPAEGTHGLATAVVVFDDKAEFLLDPPSDQPQAVREALGRIAAGSSGKELTFGAIKAVLDKYLGSGTPSRQLVLVLLSDEAGDDAALVDEMAPLLEKRLIPLYAIGSAAPWGQTNPFLARGKPDPAAAGPDAFPTHGPESRLAERVHLPLPAVGFGFRSGVFDDLIESGFGPFGLERLCRAGGGAFMAVRPQHATFAGFAGESFWPTGAEMRFDPAVAPRYAPDYVSAEAYHRLLSENQARKALCEAAKLGRAEILDTPTVVFARQANEAQMKRILDEAQQAAARVAPLLDRLYELLQAGEADREKLQGLRWQAQFDYAFGRVLAAKVRNDGYNQMLAALKAGKGPMDVQEYLLEPADSFETSSTLKKMADKARQYLERVVREHPGTPWAQLAAEDLKAPMGWKWRQ